VRIHRSAYPFSCGTRGGIFTISTPAAVNHAWVVQAARNLLMDLDERVRRGPAPRTRTESDAPAAGQYGEPSKAHRLHSEEIVRQHPARPARVGTSSRSARCGVAPGYRPPSGERVGRCRRNNCGELRYATDVCGGGVVCSARLVWPVVDAVSPRSSSIAAVMIEREPERRRLPRPACSLLVGAASHGIRYAARATAAVLLRRSRSPRS
jgi:hypothetical protein